MKKPVKLILLGLCLIGGMTISFADSVTGCGLFPNQACQLDEDILPMLIKKPGRDGYHHNGNHETNMYFSSQVQPVNNELILSAHKVQPGVYYNCADNKEAPRACAYISGWIDTQGLWSTAGIAHGYVEVSATMPVATDERHGLYEGMWPAIWMLPNNAGIGWPTHGEIDILEMHGIDPDAALTTLHYGAQPYITDFLDSTFSSNPAVNYVDQNNGYGNYHTFGLEWNFQDPNPYLTTWYDGKPVAQRFLNVNDKAKNYPIWKGPDSNTGVFYPGQQTGGYYLILNIATGGNFGATTPQTSNGSGTDLNNPLLQMKINSIKSYRLP